MDIDSGSYHAAVIFLYCAEQCTFCIFRIVLLHVCQLAVCLHCLLFAILHVRLLAKLVPICLF